MVYSRIIEVVKGIQGGVVIVYFRRSHPSNLALGLNPH